MKFETVLFAVAFLVLAIISMPKNQSEAVAEVTPEPASAIAEEATITVSELSPSSKPETDDRN